MLRRTGDDNGAQRHRTDTKSAEAAQAVIADGGSIAGLLAGVMRAGGRGLSSLSHLHRARVMRGHLWRNLAGYVALLRNRT